MKTVVFNHDSEKIHVACDIEVHKDEMQKVFVNTMRQLMSDGIPVSKLIEHLIKQSRILVGGNPEAPITEMEIMPVFLMFMVQRSVGKISSGFSKSPGGMLDMLDMLLEKSEKEE